MRRASKNVTPQAMRITELPAGAYIRFGAMFAGERISVKTVVAADPVTEVERLRLILDKLPSCLMRVSADGTLLAVSDSALELLGCRELAAVLGGSLLDRIRGEAGLLWMGFVQRVSEGGSGSVECDMRDASGLVRTVVLLGTALPHHPDGVASLLVTVRDISTARRLEASLLEQEGTRRSIQASLDAATATVQQLREQVEAAAGERRQLAVALEQLTVALHAAVTAASGARQVLKNRPAS